MKLTVLFFAATLLFTSVSGAASDFPSFDLFHSHCQVDVMIQNKLCVDVYPQLEATIDKFNAGGDPSKGVYQFKERQAISYIWATHNSNRGWFSDVLLQPIQMSEGCLIQGRSRTQSTFHSAGIENYCDLYNVYQVAEPTYANLQVTSCSKTPSDPANNCKA